MEKLLLYYTELQQLKKCLILVSISQGMRGNILHLQTLVLSSNSLLTNCIYPLLFLVYKSPVELLYLKWLRKLKHFNQRSPWINIAALTHTAEKKTIKKIITKHNRLIGILTYKYKKNTLLRIRRIRCQHIKNKQDFYFFSL